MVGNSLDLWVWGLITALGVVPTFPAGSEEGQNVHALQPLWTWAIAAQRLVWGWSLAGNGKGISRKPRTREGKLLPPVKGQARERMKMESGHCRVRQVEMERVCVSRARVCDKLLTLLWSLYLTFLRLQSAYDPQDIREMLFLCFMFSEVQQPTDGTTSPCFWFLTYSRPEHLKVKLKIFTRGNKKQQEYKWNQTIRNVRCEGAFHQMILQSSFYPVLHNQKSSLDSWGRGRAGDPVGETESDKKKPVVWNPTLSCRLELSFEVSLVMLGSKLCYSWWKIKSRIFYVEGPQWWKGSIQLPYQLCSGLTNLCLDCYLKKEKTKCPECWFYCFSGKKFLTGKWQTTKLLRKQTWGEFTAVS